MFTWSAVYNSVRYHVIPRLANKWLIDCWIVCVELYAKTTADVKSGNIKRQKRDVSIDSWKEEEEKNKEYLW
jgi:hypothetical protein